MEEAGQLLTAYDMNTFRTLTRAPDVRSREALFLLFVLLVMSVWSRTPGARPTLIPTPVGIESTMIDYSYDSLYRVTGTSYSGTLTNTFAYSYDAEGNRLTQNANGTLTPSVYANANRLASVNVQPYTWGNNGNLVSDGLLTYAYDQANRLKRVTQGANTFPLF